MGTMLADLEDHEGYGVGVAADGTELVDARSCVAYRAACGCGWRGGEHPTTDDGYDAAVDEWEHTHARPLLQRAVPRHVQELVDDAKKAIADVARERPHAAARAIDDLAAWANAARARLRLAATSTHDHPRRGPIRR